MRFTKPPPLFKTAKPIVVKIVILSDGQIVGPNMHVST